MCTAGESSKSEAPSLPACSNLCSEKSCLAVMDIAVASRLLCRVSSTRLRGARRANDALLSHPRVVVAQVRSHVVRPLKVPRVLVPHSMFVVLHRIHEP